MQQREHDINSATTMTDKRHKLDTRRDLYTTANERESGANVSGVCVVIMQCAVADGSVPYLV